MIQADMTDQVVQQLDAQFLEQVETDLVKHIVAGLRSRNVSVEEAQKLAADFLIALPAFDKEDLLNKLNILGKTYKSAQETYVDFIGDFAAAQRDEKLSTMRDLIKNGNIEAAIATAKGEK